MDYNNSRRFDGRRSPYGYPGVRRPAPAAPCGRTAPTPAPAASCGRTAPAPAPAASCGRTAPAPEAGRCSRGTSAPMFPGMPNCERKPLAMSYVPTQQWTEPYELCQAIQCGTIFPELYKPFLIGRCRR